jgi:glucan 1,3-beta-glucosidase
MENILLRWLVWIATHSVRLLVRFDTTSYKPFKPFLCIKQNPPTLLLLPPKIFTGDKEANRQLRLHWDQWVTEDIISELASIGVDHVRIPVGDWMFKPYEPFIGCWDGSIDALNRVIDLCAKYNIGVLLDVHAMRGSQNGYDNSGKAMDVTWDTSSDTYTSFDHWGVRAANWAGDWNLTTNVYDTINYDNLNFSVSVVTTIVEMYLDNPTVVGVGRWVSAASLRSAATI